MMFFLSFFLSIDSDHSPPVFSPSRSSSSRCAATFHYTFFSILLPSFSILHLSRGKERKKERKKCKVTSKKFSWGVNVAFRLREEHGGIREGTERNRGRQRETEGDRGRQKGVGTCFRSKRKKESEKRFD